MREEMNAGVSATRRRVRGRCRAMWAVTAVKPELHENKVRVRGAHTTSARKMRSTRVWRAMNAHLQTIRAFGPHLCVRDTTPRAGSPLGAAPGCAGEPAALPRTNRFQKRRALTGES